MGLAQAPKFGPDAGISIAFPQRDTHLDTLKPLEIKMVTGDGA